MCNLWIDESAQFKDVYPNSNGEIFTLPQNEYSNVGLEDDV